MKAKTLIIHRKKKSNRNRNVRILSECFNIDYLFTLPLAHAFIVMYLLTNHKRVSEQKKILKFEIKSREKNEFMKIYFDSKMKNEIKS